jgi:BMFP domain-containing protein YqiC
LFKKNASIKERANAALSSLQRNAYAMGMLRSRLESRINFVLKESNGKTEGYNELSRVLELVKNGELILQEMSEKIESARFLEEFVIIMDSAASSVSGIKDDIEQMMPAAEAALEEMHNAISKVFAGLTEGVRKEIEPAILAELTATIAADSTNAIVAAEMKEVASSHIEKEQEPERVPA